MSDKENPRVFRADDLNGSGQPTGQVEPTTETTFEADDITNEPTGAAVPQFSEHPTEGDGELRIEKVSKTVAAPDESEAKTAKASKAKK